MEEGGELRAGPFAVHLLAELTTSLKLRRLGGLSVPGRVSIHDLQSTIYDLPSLVRLSWCHLTPEVVGSAVAERVKALR